MTNTNDALLIKIKVKLKPVSLDTSSKNSSTNSSTDEQPNWFSNHPPEFDFIMDERIQIDDVAGFNFYSENNFDFAILQQNADYLYLVNDLDKHEIQFIENMNDLYDYLCRLFSKDIFQNSINYAELFTFLNKLDKFESESKQNDKIFTSSEIKKSITNHYNALNEYRKKPDNKLFNKIAAIPEDIILDNKKIQVDLSTIKNVLFDDFINNYKPVIIQNISNKEDWGAFINNMETYKTKKDYFSTSTINTWLKGYKEHSSYIDSLLSESNIDNGVIVYLKLNNKDVKPDQSSSEKIKETQLNQKLYNFKRFNIKLDNDNKTLNIGYNNDNVKYEDSTNAKSPNTNNITNYVFGNFNNIFLPTHTNSYIVENMTDVVNKVNAGNPVFIIGYGASGAGKTSSLIYLKTQKQDTEGTWVPYTENGVLPELCSKIVTQNKNITKLIVKTVEFFESDHDKGKNGAPKTMLLESDSFEFDSKLNLLIEVLYKNKHTYIVGEKEKKFDTNTPLGECITHLVDTDRFVKATTNNPQSSRSHVLVFVNFSDKDGKIISQIIVGDFAGVENQFQCKDTKVLNKFLNIETSTDKNKKFYETQKQGLNGSDIYDYYSGGGKEQQNALSEKISQITELEADIKDNSTLHLEILNASINKDDIDAEKLFNQTIQELDTSIDINKQRKNIEDNIRTRINLKLKKYIDFFNSFDKIIGNNPYQNLNQTKIDYHLSNALYHEIQNTGDMAYPSLDLKKKETIDAINDAIQKFNSFITEFYNTNSFDNESDTTKIAIYTTTKHIIVTYFEQIKDAIFKDILNDQNLLITRINDFINIYSNYQKNVELKGTIIPEKKNNTFNVIFKSANNNPLMNFHYFLLSLIGLKKGDNFSRNLTWGKKQKLPLNAIDAVRVNINNDYGFYYYYLENTTNKIVEFTGYSVYTEYIQPGDFIYGSNTTALYKAYINAIFTFVKSIYKLIDTTKQSNLELKTMGDRIIQNLKEPKQYQTDVELIIKEINNNFGSKNEIFLQYIPILEFQINNIIDTEFISNLTDIKSIAYDNVTKFIKYKSEIENNFIEKFINQKTYEVLKYVYIYYSCKYRVTEGKFINRSLKIMRNTIGTIVRSKLKNFYNYLDKCYEQYILDFKRLPSSRGSTSQDKIIQTIFKNMRDMEKFKHKKDDELMKNLSICIFGVLNITKTANNPPESPYVDINDLKSRIKNKNYTDITNILKSLLSLLEPLNINDLHMDNISQLKEIITKIKDRSLVLTDYDTINDIIDIKDNIDNLNASSAIGTLEFLDQIVKLNSTNILCRDPAPKSIAKQNENSNKIQSSALVEESSQSVKESSPEIQGIQSRNPRNPVQKSKESSPVQSTNSQTSQPVNQSNSQTVKQLTSQTGKQSNSQQVKQYRNPTNKQTKYK